MKTQTSGYLVILGVFVIFLGLIGYLTHPEKAHTALVAGGSFGALTILCGILGAKQVPWSKTAALLTAGLLGAASIWRASLSWLAVAGGQPEKLFASLVLSLMLGAATVMFVVVLTDRKRSNAHEHGEALG